MPFPAIAAAGLAAAGGLGSSFIQNAGNKRAARFAAKHNVKFWQMQNRYNHPSQQRQRLEEAGLNPNLIYGSSPSSATGNADSIADMEAPRYEFNNPLQNIHQFASIRQQQASANYLDQQSTTEAVKRTSMNTDILKQLQNIGGIKLDNQLKKGVLQTSIDAQREALRQQREKNIGLRLDNIFKDSAMSDRLMIIKEQVEQAKQQKRGYELDNQLKQYEKELRGMGFSFKDNWLYRLLGLKAGTGIKKLRDSKGWNQTPMGALDYLLNKD